MKYVLAVSGGIDSVVLLDRIVHDTNFRLDNFGNVNFPDDFIVAHFDHGIRGAESASDAAFVRDLARAYGVQFVSRQGHLPRTTSEEQARVARYKFLTQVCQDNDAALVTAHHRDDLIETVAMNLIRGTGWRGLAPMAGVVAGREILRPLLSWTKFQITTYALEHNLVWREDSTNASLLYFRNRVRVVLATVDRTKLDELYNLCVRQMQLRRLIQKEIDGLDILIDRAAGSLVLSRYYLIMLPNSVAIEILKHLTQSRLLTDQLWRLLLFVKTGEPHKVLQFKQISARLTVHTVMIDIATS